MFNETTLKDMDKIDKLISKRNQTLYKEGVFLSWTFPKNHNHEKQSLTSNYFCVWCGKVNDVVLKLATFGGVWMIEDLLRAIPDEDLIELANK